MVVPTAVVSGTPLDCTYCPDNCINKTMHDGTLIEVGWNREGTKPEFHWSWVKKYCTMEALDGFIFFFPYILLIIALLLVMIERIFLRYGAGNKLRNGKIMTFRWKHVAPFLCHMGLIFVTTQPFPKFTCTGSVFRCFNSGMKLESFYELLVKENLGHDNLEDMPDCLDDVTDGQLENNKTVLEISHSFADGSRYYKSYLARTISKQDFQKFTEGLILVTQLTVLFKCNRIN